MTSRRYSRGWLRWSKVPASPGSWRPDLVLLDVSLGGVSGVDIARKLISRWPEARLLAVSAHTSSVYVRGMINAGACGYLLKDNGPREIVDAINTIMDGGQWIGEGLSLDRA